MYKIYSLKKYTVYRDVETGDPKLSKTIKELEGDINELINELEENKGYHLYLRPNRKYILYGDLDHITNEEDFLYIIETIRKELNLEKEDIKICKCIKINKKGEEEISAHFSIPKIYGTIEEQYNLFLKIRNLEPLKLDKIDLNVYKKNRFFKLPNQTIPEENKIIPHKIVIGEMKDFIIDFVPSYSKPINIEIIAKTTYKFDESLKYEITDDEIINLLGIIGADYVEDYEKWLKVTNILKGLDKYNIWDSWSATSEKYNKQNNNKIWRGIKNICFDINYLVYLYNQENPGSQINYITSYKTFRPISRDYKPIYKNDKYVTNILSYNDFCNYDVHIIQSCTGTGKTTMMSKYTKQYISEEGNEHYKILSIIDKISLCNQHLNSFKKEDINILDYQKGFIKNNHYCICINSLLQLEQLTNDELSQYILFIDEINSFLKLTHNQNLNSNLRRIFNLLLRIVKYSHKIIVCDNIICDNVFDFLSSRNNNINFIINQFQKFEGITAQRIRNEETFLNLIKRKIEKEQYFLFGCDSCKTVEEFYFECIKDVSNKDNFILITSNHKFNIIDASEQFKNKYVFFSPSITTGVDFSIEDKQDVFIYIKGNSIDPSSIYQQTTRCRNINKLFYYSQAKNKKSKFSNYEEIKDNYNNFIIQSELLNNVCKDIDDDCNEIIINNKFFNLFCYQEYINDIYNTDKTKHFEDFLLRAKFNIKDIDEDDAQLNKEDKKILEEQRTKIYTDIFEEYINIDNIDDRKKNKFEKIEEKRKFLNLEEIENIKEYKDYLNDEETFKNHINLIRLLKSDDYINNKLNNINSETFKIKTVDTVYKKIQVLRNLEKNFNIEPLNVEYNREDKINIENKQWLFIKKLFNTTRDNPQNLKDFKPFYIHMIRAICGSNIITSKRERQTSKAKKETFYSLNIEHIQQNLLLNQYSNKTASNFDPYFIKKFDIKPFIYKPLDPLSVFINGEDETNVYKQILIYENKLINNKRAYEMKQITRGLDYTQVIKYYKSYNNYINVLNELLTLQKNI